VPVETPQPFAEALQAGERALLGGRVEELVVAETGAEAHRLAQGVEGIDLIADDAGDLAVKGIAPEVDRCERRILSHYETLTRFDA
jgi:hypothetical protein